MTATEKSPPNHSRNRNLIIAAGLLAICISIIVGATVIMRGCANALSTSVDRLEGIFKPNTTITNVLDGTVDSMKKRAKLVVQQADITAEVYRSDKYESWGIYFGTTTVRVRARGARVQYAIDLDGFSRSNIEVVETSDHQRILRIWLPEPKVDEDIVEVNFSQVEVESSSGWARFNRGEVIDAAKKLLRQAALERARDPLNIRVAEVTAEPAVRKLLDPLAESLQPDVKLEIKFIQPPIP